MTRAATRMTVPRRIRLKAYLKTAGDCPNFAQSSEQNGTVPFSEAVFG
jgi:hypothetical protein